MEEATQPGADSQTEAATENDDLVRRMAEMVDGEQPSDEGSDEAPVDDGQAEDATPEAEEEPKFTIKVDGEERQLTQSELIAEAQKAQAANKRFEEAAQLRKTFEAEQKQVAQERAMLSNALNQYTSQLQTLMQQEQPDWNALLQADPIQYLQQKEIFSQRQAQLQQAQAAQAYLMQQQQAEMQQKQLQYANEQRQKLLEAIPDWKDDAKAKAESAEVAKLLASKGYSQEEIASLMDHRMVAMARELHVLKSLIAKQQPALKKVEKLPPKVEKTGTGVRPTDGRTSAMQRLSKTGKPEDAAGLIANFI